MTVEEAINMLKSKMDGHTDTSYEWAETVRMAIKALEQQPCEEYNYKALWEQVKWERDVAIEQLEQLGYSLGEKIRTSEDCISRQYLIEKATSWDKHFADSERYVSLTDIQNAPPVTPQPKRGAWVRIGCWGRSYKCNQCGNSLDFNGVNVGRGNANFCPNCGADMRGDNSDGRNHAIYIIDNHLKEVKTDGR